MITDAHTQAHTQVINKEEPTSAVVSRSRVCILSFWLAKISSTLDTLCRDSCKVVRKTDCLNPDCVFRHLCHLYFQIISLFTLSSLCLNSLQHYVCQFILVNPGSVPLSWWCKVCLHLVTCCARRGVSSFGSEGVKLLCFSLECALGKGKGSAPRRRWRDVGVCQLETLRDVL